VNWIEQTSAGSRPWSSITSSSDGTKLAACAVRGGSVTGYIYTSTDGGVNWTEQTTAGSRLWVSITSSSDGTKLVACVYNGNIYTSSDSGVNWIEQTSAGQKIWSSITSSSDGTKLAACADDGGYIYTSSDSGLHWTEQTSAGSRNWYSITSSSDGTKLAACVGGGGGGYIYTSSDSGLHWTEQTSAGSRFWRSITSSNDGTKLAAGVANGFIYTSSDSGVNWIEETSAGSRFWRSITSSSQGTKLAAGVNNGYIYTGAQRPSPTPTPTPTPTPSPTPTPTPTPKLVSSRITFGGNRALMVNSSVTSYINGKFIDQLTAIQTTSPNTITIQSVANGSIVVTYYITSYWNGNINYNTSYYDYNDILNSLAYILGIDPYSITILLDLGDNRSYHTINDNPICFKEGTKILCYLTSNEDKYVPIEKITDSMYVKTYKHGYKRAKFIVKGVLHNTKQKTMNKLYKFKKTKDNILTEDLYVTGSHAILYDKLSEKDDLLMKILVEKYHVDYNMKIDDKHKLIAYYDENFEEVNTEEDVNIYHIVLDSDKDIYANYGIYVNGILAESTDEITLYRMNNYELINARVKTPVKTKTVTNTESNRVITTKVDKYLRQRQIEEQQRDEIIKIKSIKYKQNGYDDDETNEKTQIRHKQKTYKNNRIVNRKKNMTYKC